MDIRLTQKKTDKEDKKQKDKLLSASDGRILVVGLLFVSSFSHQRPAANQRLVEKRQITPPPISPPPLPFFQGKSLSLAKVCLSLATKKDSGGPSALGGRILAILRELETEKVENQRRGYYLISAPPRRVQILSPSPSSSPTMMVRVSVLCSFSCSNSLSSFTTFFFSIFNGR